MNNIEKKLDALIGALGFDVEEVMGDVFVGCYSGRDIHNKQVINYRLTKRGEPVNHVGSLIDMSLRIAPDKPTSIKPCTKLKSEILWLLGKAGKQPKKETITLINHQIDLAFNKGIDIE